MQNKAERGTRVMGVEIERKFLVKDDSWRSAVESEAHLVQGYLADGDTATVRVRITDDAAYLTIKGPTIGVRRSEYEYPIPLQDARIMLRELAVYPAIDKTRYQVRVGSHLWELDLFAGENAGLVLAELELGCEDEPFELPAWAGEDVSDDLRYYNVNLAWNPYRQW